MLIKHMAACLVATALVAAPALAQSPTAGGTDRPAASDNRTGTLGSPAMNAPGTSAPSASSTTTSPGNSTTGAGASTAQTTAPTPPPATPAPAGGSSTSASSASSGSTMQQLQPGQFLASDLIGTRVVGQNNEAIGDVNDVVMGQDGKAMAILVGVGGFLGIGEKDVAIPFDQAKVMYDSGDANQTGSTGTTGSTGGAASTGGSGSNAAGSASTTQEPQRIVVTMSKEQLQQAPAFRTSAESNAGGNTGASGSSTTGTAPRQ